MKTDFISPQLFRTLTMYGLYPKFKQENINFKNNTFRLTIRYHIIKNKKAHFFDRVIEFDYSSSDISDNLSIIKDLMFFNNFSNFEDYVLFNKKYSYNDSNNLFTNIEDFIYPSISTNSFVRKISDIKRAITGAGYIDRITFLSCDFCEGSKVYEILSQYISSYASNNFLIKNSNMPRETFIDFNWNKTEEIINYPIIEDNEEISNETIIPHNKISNEISSINEQIDTFISETKKNKQHFSISLIYLNTDNTINRQVYYENYSKEDTKPNKDLYLSELGVSDYKILYEFSFINQDEEIYKSTVITFQNLKFFP